MTSTDLFDLAPIAMIVVADGHLALANAAAVSLFGLSSPLPAADGSQLPVRPEPGFEASFSDIFVRDHVESRPLRLCVGDLAAQDLLVSARAIPWHAASARLLTCQQGPADAAALAVLGPLASVPQSDEYGIALVDIQSLLPVNVSDSLCRMLARTREDLTSQPMQQVLVDSADESGLRLLHADAIARFPSPTVSRHVCLRSDGRNFPAEVTRQVVWTGTRWLIATKIRDLGEQARTRFELERFRAAVDASGEMVTLIDPQSCTYLDVNQTACRLLGFTRDELLTMATYQTSALHDSLEAAQEVFREVIRGHPRVSRYRDKLRTRHGDLVPMEFSRAALLTEGRWLIVTSGRDMREAENARRRLELFRQALDQAKDAITLVDRQTMRLVDANETAAELAGLSREEYLELACTDILTGLANDDLEILFDRVIARCPRPVYQRTRLGRRGGASYLADSWISATQADGRWLVMICTRDVTEQVQAQTRAHLLATTVNFSSVATTLVDVETLRNIEVNDAACAMLGRTREALLGDESAGQPHRGADRQAVLAFYREICRQFPTTHIEHTVVDRPDGSQIPVEIRRQGLLHDGRWLITVAMTDISERRIAQAQLERFRAALDSAVDAIMLIDCERIEYIDFNHRTCELLGYTREELVQLGPHHTSILYPTRELYREFFRCAIQEPSRVRINESRRRRKDGTLIPLEFTTRVVETEQGWLGVVTARDITDRKAAQHSLERFRSVVDQAADAIFLIDPRTHQFIDVNETALRLLGWDRPKLLELPSYRMTAKLAGPAAATAHDQAIVLAAPRDFVNVEDFIRSDGQHVPVEVTRRAVLFDEQWTIVVTARDIRERLAARAELDLRIAELARSNKDLEQFAYIVSHDLNEPLRMISAYTDLLARRYSSQLDDDAREFMSFITGGSFRMKRLIEDLLRYSRAGRGARKMRTVAMDEVMRDVVQNLSQRISETGATVLADGLPVIQADRTSMLQLLQNLVGNALKFISDQPPVIRVEASHHAGVWEFAVSDNGIGIDPRHFDRIFLVFQRLHAPDRYEGTGIGLAICKKIVEHHGGQIRVESTPGQGTRFMFTIASAEQPR